MVVWFVLYACGICKRVKIVDWYLDPKGSANELLNASQQLCYPGFLLSATHAGRLFKDHEKCTTTHRWRGLSFGFLVAGECSNSEYNPVNEPSYYGLR